MSANIIYDELVLFMYKLGGSDVLIKKIVFKNIGTCNCWTVNFDTM